ncbi:hypothetical protein ABZ172_00120 [Streptomyces sp. NPDC006296]|uniref:hypothetical protein n=1 Tax=Streptomyces sp. NPDC006296 TaxID=3156746 RepID=UPI0033A9ACCB
MRSPARLVTGTAAAALTAAALGLAAPSAHAEGGSAGPERFVAAAPAPADCGPEAGSPAMAPCDDDGAAADDPAAVGDGLDPLMDPEADDLGPADGPTRPEDPSAVSGTSWPRSDEGDTGTMGEGDGAGTAQRPGTGTGNRPAPDDPAETGPGSAKPPVPPEHRPTTAPTPSRPSGHVGTGVGGSAAPDTAQLAAGAGLVGAAAVAGVLLLRRSRRAYGPRR